MDKKYFSPRAIIGIKRDGGILEAEAIQAFVAGITEGTVSEGQMAAFAMAIYFRGMSAQETMQLTRAMTYSGVVLDWSAFDLSGPVLDKHSTGGIGDKVSLMLAPMLAACGAYVPMISGRGLGHTGGTADKLESIPGYTTVIELSRFQKIVKEIGCAIICQTPELAPADKKLYACRDNTGTVASTPLIVSSILSKKLASGLQALVMQVNFGNGAFMQHYEEALVLAHALVQTGAAAGLPMTALMTDMNQVIGHSVGHAVEVLETIDFLTGAAREPRLLELTLALGAEVLVLSGLAKNLAAARADLILKLDKGLACEYFSKMVAALGGPVDLVEQPHQYLERAPHECRLTATRSGRISSTNARGVGMAVMGMGGGREFNQDVIDFGVGVTQMCHVGTQVNIGDTLAVVYARSKAQGDEALRALQKTITFSDAPVVEPVIVCERIVS